MSTTATTQDRRHPRSLVFYLALMVAASVLVVAGAATLWPITLSAAGLALIASFAVVEAHPILVRHQSRAEFITLGELVAAVALLALPVDEAVWVIVGGALLSPAVIKALSRESLSRAPFSRHVLNFSVRMLSAAPMVALTALAAPAGAGVLAAATATGLVAYGVVSHLVVRGAIHRASAPPARTSTLTSLRDPVVVAVGIAAIGLPLGLVLRQSSPDWPIIVAIAAAIVMVSRARMDHDHATHQLTSLSAASRRISTASSVGELDRLLPNVLADALRCGTVTVQAAPPPGDAGRASLFARLGDDGPWIVASHRLMRAHWTRQDQELLEAVCALAAPERRRLQLLEQVQEAERFTSLVLTTAGHDITNQLHAAAMAVGTVSRWDERLDAEERRSLIQRGETAVLRAANALRDLTAVGSRGLAASTSGADTALFVRSLSPHIHVAADNVGIAAPAPIVERAVENLVRNAERHHDADDPLEVEIVSDGDVVRVEIRDRGPGLAPGQVDTLFRPFTQLADGRRQRGSLGLGLFIARGLAESVGGSLDYRDRDGGGSVFALTLPSADGDAPHGGKERVVLGPGADRDPQAAREPGPGREVPDEDALTQ